MSQQEFALIQKCKTTIEGLISLLNVMTITGREYYIKNDLKWFQTGHGQIAEKTLKEIEEYQ